MPQMRKIEPVASHQVRKPKEDDWVTIPDDKDWETISEEEDPRSTVGKAWDFINAPLWEAPATTTRGWAEDITDPRNRLDEKGNVRNLHPLASFGAGALEGIGNLVSGLTSPLNLVTTLATGGASAAAKTGFPAASRALGITGRTLSAPVIVHGAQTAFDPDPERSMMERAFGVAEMAGGGAGVLQPITPKVGGRPTPTRVNPAVAEASTGGVPISEADLFEAMGRPQPKAPPPPPEPPLMGGTVPVRKFNVPEGQPMDPVAAVRSQAERRGPLPERLPPSSAAEQALADAKYMEEHGFGDLATEQRENVGPALPEMVERQPSASETVRSMLRGETPEVVDPSLEAFVNRAKEADRTIEQFNLERKEVPGRPGDRGDEFRNLFEKPPDEEPAFSRVQPENELDKFVRSLGMKGDELSLVNESPTLNASGESAASMEAMSRQTGMRGRGEQFVVYDRTGQARPLIGPEAVDYTVRPGETYGVQGPQGFQVLDDMGGKYPMAQDIATMKAKLPNIAESMQTGRTALPEEPLFSRVEKPRAEGVGKRSARIDALKQQIDEAYRANDINKVVRLSQDLAEIQNAEGKFSETAYGTRPGTREDYPGDFDLADTSLSEYPSGKAEDLNFDKMSGFGSVKDTADNMIRQARGNILKAEMDATSNRQLHDLNSPKDKFWAAVSDAIRNSEDEGPQFAKVGKGKAQISVNVRRSAKELTTGYSQPLPEIMVREGLQNSIDVIRNMGPRGEMSISIDDNRLVIGDNGRGMSPQELYTVYTNLHESGKVSDTGAAGGKGVGKAPFMLGGSHFEVTTVKEVKGQKIKSTFSGTPEQLMEPFDIHSEVVDSDTPTGTQFVTKFTPDQYSFQARTMLDKILKFSRDIPGTIQEDKYGSNFHKPVKFKSRVGDTSLAKELTNDSANEVELLIPHDAVYEPRSSMQVHYLNKGMYQFSKGHYMSEQVPNMPDNVIMDISPLVEEGDAKYPFPVQRESVKETLAGEIEKFIDEKLVTPYARQKKYDLAKLWGDMPVVSKAGSAGTIRDIVIFDPGNRLTPDELNFVQNSPVVKNLTQIIDGVIDDVISVMGKTKWANKLERVGLTLAPEMYGVHIPNPSAAKDAPKSAILINPFGHIKQFGDEGFTLPSDAAIDTVVTMLHEVAHIGSEDVQLLTPMTPEDLNDPRVGRYLQTYLKQVLSQGGLDMGHGMPFIHRLGDVYARYGTQRGLFAASEIESIIGDQSGGYNPEFQELLRIYKESRGRTATTEDILSGTGVKSADRGAGEGNIPSPNPADGGGTTVHMNNPTPERVKRALELGYKPTGRIRKDGSLEFVKVGTPQPTPVLESEVGLTRGTPSGRGRGQKPPPPPPPPPGTPPSMGDGGHIGQITNIKKPSKWVEAFNLPRAMMATWDLSAPLRQGIGLIHRPEFWHAFGDMFNSWGSEDAFRQVQNSIADRALFRPRKAPGDKIIPSFAEEAGLQLTDLTDLSKREEALMSTWAEKVPLVRRSNRAYTAFLNKLRADTFEALIKQNEIFGAGGTKNVPLARALADYVNTATGRGSLKFGKVSLEKNAVLLNTMLFAPRLIASRLRMLNPATYIMANPAVRKEYLKSLFAIAATGNIVTQLGKMAGGEIESDPASSDFGKLKIGNVRLDPYAGFQQYIVAANRLMVPAPLGGQRVKSSTSGKEYDLLNPQGPFDPSHLEIMARFGRGKLHPVLGFAVSLLDATKEMSGQKMNFTSLNPMENAITQRFIPIIVQDVYRLAQEDPKLAAMLGPLAGFGMGIQAYDSNEIDK